MITTKTPKGATHVRIISGKKKSGPIPVKNISTLDGVAGTIQFMKKQGSKFVEVPVVLNKAAKKAANGKKEGKTKFIGDLIQSGQFNAREIAAKVVKQYPDASMTAEAQFAKALRFTRAVPWHLKRKGVIATYKRAHNPKPVPVAAKPIEVQQAVAA